MKKYMMVIAGLSSLLCCVIAPAQSPQTLLNDAWNNWQKGNIEDVESIATTLGETDEARHLRFLCAFVQGKYGQAEQLYRDIGRTYKKLNQLDKPMLQALLHQHRYDHAVKFAKARSLDKTIQASVSARAETPLTVSLDKLTVIPFAKHQLTAYFPAFATTLNDKKTIVHLDTGGTWLIMGPDRAKKLGIELQDAGKGFHGLQKVNLQRGWARSLRLGDAVLNNVPVVAMPTLKGSQDFVIFGTNVLQQFHATMDYPDQKLLLSPRGHQTLTNQHMQVHNTKRVDIPFYMWGDHYMFVRGRFGMNNDLNFFVDSGLVALNADTGKVRQACFTTTPELYHKWGVQPEATKRKFFVCNLPVSLGPLEQTNQYFTTTPKPIPGKLGGVQIDGLISHAFLKQYVWTIDFDRMRYVFSNPNH